MSNRWWAKLAAAARPDPFGHEKTAREKTRAYAERYGPQGEPDMFKRLVESVANLPERTDPREWAPIGELPGAKEHWGWLREWSAQGGDLERVGADERSMFVLGCDARGPQWEWAREAALTLGAREALSAPYQKTPLGNFFEKTHPLEIALSRGSHEMVQMLEAAGASWESCRMSDEALAQRARSSGMVEPLAWLESKGAKLRDAGPIPLLDFNQWPGEDEARAIECAERLLALGADPSREPANPAEFGGSAPLSAALDRGFGNLALVLQKAGATVGGPAQGAHAKGEPSARPARGLEEVVSILNRSASRGEPAPSQRPLDEAAQPRFVLEGAGAGRVLESLEARRRMKEQQVLAQAAAPRAPTP